ncbi:MAG: tetratricopeptide repeat protein, partial [Desulfobacterales bacterium]
NALADKGDLQAAVDHYQQAINQKPDYDKAYNNLGNVLKDLGQIDAAIKNFRKAIEIKPNYPGALNNLGNALRAKDRTDDAIKIFRQAIDQSADSAESYCHLGNAFKDQGEFESALRHYRQAIQMKPDFAEAHFNASIVHLLKGDFSKGWKEYEWRLQREEWKTICCRRADLPRWDGESFIGKRLCVYDEQGFGDTLQFVRYLPLVKTRGGEVIFETRKALIGLLNDFPGIDDLVERLSYDQPAADADLYISLLSLPGIFNTRLETIPHNIPYLSAEHEKVKYWRRRLGENGFKVGVVWAGQPIHTDDRHRSCPLKQFAPLLEIPGVRLIGLQKGDAAKQHFNQEDGKIPFINLEEELNDFADTAGLIENLDLVISVDTAVAHLAGAMGKPVWVLLPFIPDWRWMLDQNDTPWYPSMRLFRQKMKGDWNNVFKQVAKELRVSTEIRGDKKKSSMISDPAGKLFKQANQFYDRDDFPKAISAYQKTIEVKNDFLEAYFNLANIYKDQGDFDLALSYYQQALQINPNFFQARYNMGVVLQMQGKTNDAILAYQRTLQLKPDFAEAYNNMGTALREQEKLGPAIECFQEAVKLKPRYAQAYLNMGSAFHVQGQLDKAIESYQSALVLRPGYAEAFHKLGLSLHKQGKLTEALECYRKALQLKPDYVEAYYSMGNFFLEQDNLDEMTRWFQKVLELKPGDAQVFNNIGKMFLFQRKISEAESYFRQAIRINPDFAEAHFNRSITHFFSGNYLEGFREYEWRLKMDRWKNVYPYRFEKPRWDGAPFAGKQLFVHGEQGFGDTLQFARYLPLIKALGGTVIFETAGSLIDIFQNFPGVDRLVKISPHHKSELEFDFYIPLLSLPGIFQTTLETIPAEVPYIFADSHKKEMWQKRLDTSNFRVGIVWAGGSMHIKDNSRSCRLNQFLPLTRIAAVQVYGLQKGPASSQVEEFSDQIVLNNYGEEFKDFSDTAAMISALDLVISVDTAVAHLAGAMGKPVWVLLPTDADWRWMLARDDTPWYPTMRLFRQNKTGDWDDVFQRVADELGRFVAQQTAAQNWLEENYK